VGSAWRKRSGRSNKGSAPCERKCGGSWYSGGEQTKGPGPARPSRLEPLHDARSWSCGGGRVFEVAPEEELAKLKERLDDVVKKSRVDMAETARVAAVRFGALEEVFMSYRPHGAWKTMEVLEELA
jgi:hypothetical protein